MEDVEKPKEATPLVVQKAAKLPEKSTKCNAAFVCKTASENILCLLNEILSRSLAATIKAPTPRRASLKQKEREPPQVPTETPPMIEAKTPTKKAAKLSELIATRDASFAKRSTESAKVAGVLGENAVAKVTLNVKSPPRRSSIKPSAQPADAAVSRQEPVTTEKAAPVEASADEKQTTPVAVEKPIAKVEATTKCDCKFSRKSMSAAAAVATCSLSEIATSSVAASFKAPSLKAPAKQKDEGEKLPKIAKPSEPAAVPTKDEKQEAEKQSTDAKKPVKLKESSAACKAAFQQKTAASAVASCILSDINVCKCALKTIKSPARRASLKTPVETPDQVAKVAEPSSDPKKKVEATKDVEKRDTEKTQKKEGPLKVAPDHSDSRRSSAASTSGEHAIRDWSEEGGRLDSLEVGLILECVPQQEATGANLYDTFESAALDITRQSERKSASSRRSSTAIAKDQAPSPTPQAALPPENAAPVAPPAADVSKGSVAAPEELSVVLYLDQLPDTEYIEVALYDTYEVASLIVKSKSKFDKTIGNCKIIFACFFYLFVVCKNTN